MWRFTLPNVWVCALSRPYFWGRHMKIMTYFATFAVAAGLAASADAATVSVQIPTFGSVDDSGPSPSVTLTANGASGASSVDGAAAELKGSVKAASADNTLTSVDTFAGTGNLEYLVQGSGRVTVSIGAYVSADWTDLGPGGSATLLAGLGLTSGSDADQARINFVTPNAADPLAGSIYEFLVAEITVTAGATILFNANLETLAATSCTGRLPPFRDCGSVEMDASSTMSVFLNSISPGGSLLQTGGDAFALAPLAAVPLPATGFLLAGAMGGLAALRRRGQKVSAKRRA